MTDTKSAANAASSGSGSGVGQSRGKLETELLKATINDQLNRLLTQLEDLDTFKDGTQRTSLRRSGCVLMRCVCVVCRVDLEGEYESMKEERNSELLEF